MGLFLSHLYGDEERLAGLVAGNQFLSHLYGDEAVR